MQEPMKITMTVVDKWESLSEVERTQHALENSEFYQLVENAKKMTAQVESMNQHVPEEFHVRLPTMYYVESYGVKIVDSDK